jgi:hypothetical protein
VREVGQDPALAGRWPAQDGVEGGDGGDRQRVDKVEDRLAVVATPDPVLVLDRCDVDTAAELSGDPAVVGPDILADPVMDLRRVVEPAPAAIEGDDLVVTGGEAQIAREGRDAAATGWVGGDESDAGDGVAPIEAGASRRSPGAADGWIGAGRAGPVRSGRAHRAGTEALGVLLDREVDLLPAAQAIEVEGCVEGAAVEEVLLLVLGGDESEAAVGNDALDGSGGHG